MKKIICFLCLSVMLFSLLACDPGSRGVSKEELIDVVSVELIEYQNSNQQHFLSWVPNHFDKLKPFNDANARVVERLPIERMADFLDAFTQTDILNKYYAYDSPADVCIRINYYNGNFLIVWADYEAGSFAGYIGEYSADGTVLSFWGSFSGLDYYKDLVNNFFDYKI